MPPRVKSRSRQIVVGFTLIEMIVVLVVVAILVGIGLAIGAKIRDSTETELTRTELAVLTAELNRLEHRTGSVPQTMTEFLQADQDMYLQPGPNGTWKVGSCAITRLPPAVLVPGIMPGPGGQGVPYVAAVNDAWGTAIQFISQAAQNPRAPFFFSAGPDGIIGTPDDIFSYSP